MTWEAYRPWLNQPHEVSLETQALCNAACTFCPYPTLERIGTRMPDDLIDRLVGEMAGFDRPFMFSPFKVNEPLLDSRVIPLLQRMNQEVPHARLRIFTNGSPLTTEKAEQIAKLENVEHLWISLNESTPKEYEATMGLKWDQVTRRIDSLHAMDDFPHPVCVSRVGKDENFVKLVSVRWPRFQPVTIKRDGWLGFTTAYSDEIPDTPCSRWWELNIMADGRVAHCCMDGKGEFPIGDVNTQTLLEAYNTRHWRERRAHLLSRRGLHPCSTCSY